MLDASDLRIGRVCVHRLRVQLVFWVIRPSFVLDDDHVLSLREISEKVCADFGASLRGIDGGCGNVSLLVDYPPTISLSRLVNSLKGVSSRQMRKRHQHIESVCWKGSFWSPGYSAFSYHCE